MVDKNKLFEQDVIYLIKNSSMYSTARKLYSEYKITGDLIRDIKELSKQIVDRHLELIKE